MVEVTPKKGNLLFACVSLFLVNAASAWDPQIGHPNIIARGEIILRQATSDGFPEIQVFRDRIEDGAESEDGALDVRGRLHFHNPKTTRPNAGLFVHNLNKQFPDAIAEAQSIWENTPVVSLTQGAINAYRIGLKSTAYQFLGRVAHIVAGDFFQPSHVHDDPHAPKLFGGDVETIETLFRLNPGLASSVGLQPVSPLGDVPLTADGIQTFGQAASLLTYNGSVFGGDFPVTPIPGDEATIDVGAGNAIVADFVSADPSSNDMDLQIPHWRIQIAPTDPKGLVFDISVRGDIFADNRNQDWWLVPEDEGANLVFFDRMNLITHASGDPLDRHFIKQFVPQAISHTAGLLRAAARTFDPLSPAIELADPFGNTISLGGYTRSNVIAVKATDPADTEHPTASGIYRIVLNNLAAGTEQTIPFAGLQDGLTGPHIATHPFVLPEGNYLVSAFDGLGNKSDFPFGIDTTSPTITFNPPAGPSDELEINSSDFGAGLLFTHAIHIQNGSVVDEIVTTISGSPKPAQQLFAENLTTFSIVAAQAMDAAGNIERKNWLGDSGLIITPALTSLIQSFQDQKIQDSFVDKPCSGNFGQIVTVPAGSAASFPGFFCPDKNIPPIQISSLLEALDKAKSLPEWQKARERLKSLGPESHSALRAYIKDAKKDGRKRFMALSAICQHLSQGQAEEELLKAFREDTDPYFRLSCAMEMGKSKSAHCQEALRKAVSNPRENSFVQVASALGLAKMGDSFGKERALKAILNAEPVASFGIEALAELKAQELIPTLQKHRSSKDYFVRNNCRLAILRIQMAEKTQTEQAKLLQEALLEDGYFHVRKWAGVHLGERGDEVARALLLELVKDPRAPPGKDAAQTGLLIGVEKGHWTREDIQRWLRP